MVCGVIMNSETLVIKFSPLRKVSRKRSPNNLNNDGAGLLFLTKRSRDAVQGVVLQNLPLLESLGSVNE